MLDFFRKLFDTSDFPPRWECGSWTDGHGWLHIYSDLGVWSAYVAIPCVLVYFAYRRKDVPFRKVFLLFGAFILACGTTHLMEAIIFWQPMYRLAGLIKLGTAVVSWATVIALIPVTPRALAMRSPEVLEGEITQRRKVENELQRANEELEKRVSERTMALAQANQALQAERAFGELVLQQMPAGVMIAEPWSGKLRFSNHEAQRILGNNLAPDGRLDGSQFGPQQWPLAKILLSQTAVKDQEIEMVLLGGEKLTLNASSSMVHYEQNDRHAAVVVFIDVSEQKRLRESLRESDRRKDEFLAVLAHELRNPLAPIRNGLQILKHTSGTEAEAAKRLMERQLNQLVHLVDDLLDVSRISRGKIALRRESIMLAEVIRDAVETSQPLIEAGGHELIVDLPPEPIWLDADPTRLSQVFSNLLNNAAKFTERGGHICIRAKRDGDQVQVTVADDGIGIARELQPQLFGLFTQLDRGLERAHGGLGIGLSLVKGLVELHGGTVQAKSAGAGKGSEFVVCLPVASTPPSVTKEPRNAFAVSPKRRVLVVDDSKDAAQSLQLLLSLQGHEVSVAHDGQEAIKLAEQIQPECVLMDIGMPNLNGYEAARRIRQTPWGRSIRLIAVTGWGQEDDRRQSKDAGFDFHLTKPVDLKVLNEILATAGANS
ncbi:MAG: ATP-binding protein [Gemmataceae bacterium]